MADTQEPDDPEFSLPDWLATADPETTQVAVQRQQAAASGDPLPPWGCAYERVRVRDWE